MLSPRSPWQRAYVERVIGTTIPQEGLCDGGAGGQGVLVGLRHLSGNRETKAQGAHAAGEAIRGRPSMTISTWNHPARV